MVVSTQTAGPTPEGPGSVEEPRSHEQDLLALVAAGAAGKRAVFERLHGVEVPDHQENNHDD